VKSALLEGGELLPHGQLPAAPVALVSGAVQHGLAKPIADQEETVLSMKTSEGCKKPAL